jgi:GNAT superfamily N-acetyltransferase
MCFICIVDGNLAGFTSLIHFPHPRAKNIKKFHRTVVLPDYQGIGVATHMRDAVSEKIKSMGFRLMTTTSHPAMIAMLKRDPKWRLTRKGRVGKLGKTSKVDLSKTSSLSRITTSWEYR